MGNGVHRKQYQALASFADGISVSYTTPTGSFNEKFCDLCRQIINDLGGTFSPIKGGAFASRKASYLRQVAVAIGITTTEAGSSFRETFLKAAHSIWDNGNDGDGATLGASLDWRVYQYLAHAVGFDPSQIDELLQWIYTFSPPATAVDKTANALDVDYVDSNCVTPDGVGDMLNTSVALNFGSNDYSVSFLFRKTSAATFSSYFIDGRDLDNDGFRAAWVGSSTRKLFITHNEFDLIIDQPLSDGNWHTVNISKIGTVLSATVDGTPHSLNGVTGDISVFSLATIGEQSGGSSGDNFEGDLACVRVDGYFNYTMSIGYGLGEPDTSGNGNDGLWSTVDEAALRSGTQDVSHRHVEYGFSLWEHATLPDLLVSYGDDGNPLPFAKTGYTKTADYPPVTGNQTLTPCETKLQQKAANPEFLDNEDWSLDGITYDKKSFGDLRTHPNYRNNIIVCSTASSIIAAWTLPQSYGWTPTTYAQFNNYLVAQGCTGSSRVPFMVLDGMGGETPWLDVNGNILLLNP